MADRIEQLKEAYLNLPYEDKCICYEIVALSDDTLPKAILLSFEDLIQYFQDQGYSQLDMAYEIVHYTQEGVFVDESVADRTYKVSAAYGGITDIAAYDDADYEKYLNDMADSIAESLDKYGKSFSWPYASKFSAIIDLLQE